MATCAKCGAALTATAKFCGACGTRVAPSVSAPPGRPSSSVPPRSSADPFAKTVFGGDAAPRSPVPPPPAAPPAPPASAAYRPGTLVLVHWADGNRYPATVLHATATHVFVAFSTGQQQWVDVRYVSSGT